MTDEVASATTPLYHSPRGLMDFQAEGVARTYLSPSVLAVWDTGLGKTHLDMATAALLFEDDRVDIHLLVCEQTKVAEWVEDFERFTRLHAVSYTGSADRRRKIVASIDSPEPIKIGRKKTDTIHRPQVLVGTYETFRNDLMEMQVVVSPKGRKTKKSRPHFLSLALSGKRVFVGYDEMTKIGNRGNSLHEAQQVLVKHVRSTGGSVQMLGLTATPAENGGESHYNLGRLLAPECVGTVASFERDHVAYRDAYGNVTRYKNLSRETLTEPWVVPLAEKMAPIVMRKRKTDPDVIEQFPKVSERFVKVDLTPEHREFYDAVCDILEDEVEDDPTTLSVLRMIAGYPAALLHSQGRWAQAIVAEVGEAYLRSLGSSKVETLSTRMAPIMAQGDRAVVFTFYGPSMVPLIAQRLREDGIAVAEHYGAGMTPADRERAKAKFRAGDAQVLVSSDAGARGINLPQASYAFEFETASTHGRRTQRLNRIHRLDSLDHGHAWVYFQTLVANHTVEVGLTDLMLRRNEWSDSILGDEDEGEDSAFITAADRKRLLRAG